MSSDCARHFFFRTPALIQYLPRYVSQQSAVASRYSSDETDGGYSTSCIGHMLHTGTYPGRSSNDVAGLSNMPPATRHRHSMVRSYYIVHRT